MNFSIKEKWIHRLQKETYCYQNGNAGGGQIRNLGLTTYTTAQETDNQ